MSRHHDLWYKKLFSDPGIVEDLMRAFVKEPFVKNLDFSSLKKLNTTFVSPEFRKREADVIYEISSHGQSSYIYLLLEFQSTVDRFMALRMARYVFEFYQEIQKLGHGKLLNPAFPILIYNGDDNWTAPESFSELLVESPVPKKYLPEFRYFKIAVNELTKRELVKIRNAVAVLFYVENSTPVEISKNRKELVLLLADVLQKEGSGVVQQIINWMYAAQKISVKAKKVDSIQDLTEVSSMWESAVKKHEEALLEKGATREKQSILIDLMTIKFGELPSTEQAVKRCINTGKLDLALRKILSANRREDVLACLSNN